MTGASGSSATSSPGESSDHPIRPTLWEINNTGLDLRKVYNYPGAMAVLVEALKQKGVRFDEGSFQDGDITYLDKDIVVLRGAAYEVVHRAFEGDPR